MLLRPVELTDVEAYVRMRCDPVMMAELGGPLPREGIEDKVARDVRSTAEDVDWVLMIVPDPARPEVVAGSVCIWAHPDDDGSTISEVGWMVLPEYQGRGLGKHAVRALLGRAGVDGRWGTVHAFPGVTNGPSNGICRSLGFRLLGERDFMFAGRELRCNDWAVETTSP